MICLDCGCYVSADNLKPCKPIYKDKYPDGVPICNVCCNACRQIAGMGEKKGCEYLDRNEKKIVKILKEYTKKHRILASSVILEEYAEELVKHGCIIRDEPLEEKAGE